MEFIRKSDNAARWCTNCKYFNDGSTGRMWCNIKFLKLYPTVSIYNICLKLVPDYIGNELRNYVYVVPK